MILPVVDESVGPPKPDSCKQCVGSQWGARGYMARPEGPGTAWNGVLLVGEALGEQEAASGKPFVGKAGLTLSQMLQRGGFNREHFVIDNALRCRPPGNLLAHQPYEQSALASCAPHLDGTIRDLKPRAVVPLGDVALRRMLGVSSFGKGDSLTKRRGFVERLDRWGTWMVPTFHPSFLMRGNRHLTEVFLSDIRRAVEIAGKGYHPHVGEYISDPSVETAERWVSEVEARVRAGEDISLAADIETPFKADAEDEGQLDMDDPTFTILRVGFCFRGRDALSLAWVPHYIPLIKRLLALPCRKLTWNGRYDMPRLRANGVVINGEEWDLMWAWHILHSSLPKGLGFVASVLLPDVQRWKHLSSTEAGKYNALDAMITWRLEHEIISRLKATDLWPSYYRHIVQLDKILLPMGERGMPVDKAARESLAKDLTSEYDKQLSESIAVIPRAARRAKLFKVKPKDFTDVVVEKHTQKIKVCSICGAQKPRKDHFKAFKKKVNPCAGGYANEVSLSVDTYVKLLPWVPSNKQMSAYLVTQGHKGVFGKGEKRENLTFNEEAVKVLMRRYPDDPLYPRIVDLRELETLASRYSGWYVDGRIEGGVPVDSNYYVHPTFLHNPSTLRLACQAPNMQNIPRPSKASPWPGRVKGMFVAPPGHLLFEIDYSAIEAVLVGYFARSARYIRLAKMGVHDYLNAHILHQTGKIPFGDIPDLGLSDTDLKKALKALKGAFPEEREVAKRIVHGGNYGMTPRRMWELYPKEFPTLKQAAHLQGIYYEVCPEVRTWQQESIEVADNGASLRNPYGYVHHFFHVKEWFKHDGRWQWKWGEDAKAVLAFQPQSTAAAIIKEAMLRIAEKGLDYYLRLQVHDSLVGSAPRESVSWVREQISRIMTEPVNFLPLSVVGQEGFLAIDVEAKEGERWSDMKEVR
jgi:uracil-DNA glycosylase family 4